MALEALAVFLTPDLALAAPMDHPMHDASMILSNASRGRQRHGHVPGNGSHRLLRPAMWRPRGHGTPGYLALPAAARDPALQLSKGRLQPACSARSPHAGRESGRRIPSAWIRIHRQIDARVVLLPPAGLRLPHDLVRFYYLLFRLAAAHQVQLVSF